MTKILNTLNEKNFLETIEKAKPIVSWRGAVRIEITDGDVNHVERITRNDLCKRAAELSFDADKMVVLKERISKLDNEASALLNKKSGLVRLLHSIWAFFGNIGYNRTAFIASGKTAVANSTNNTPVAKTAEDLEAENVKLEKAAKEQNALELMHDYIKFNASSTEDKEFVRLYKVLEGPSTLTLDEKNRETFQAMTKLADETNYSFACYYLARYYKNHNDFDANSVDRNRPLYEQYLFLAADAGHTKALADAAEINDQYLERALFAGNEKMLKKAESKKFSRKQDAEIELIKKKEAKTAEDYISLGIASITSLFGINQNERIEAFGHYTQAMNTGSADGKYLVAKCYYEQNGTAKDEAKALQMFKELAESGHVLAKGWLAVQNAKTSKA